MNLQHYPVMNKEIIEVLSQTGRKLFIDCTLGMGGHARHMLEAFENSRVIGIDVDAQSLEQAKANLAEFGDRVEFHRFNFTRLFEQLDMSAREVSGIVIDPGLSICQVKDPDRGFSHSIDAPLDMRKDKDSELTAAHVVNSYSEAQLTGIFEKYGEIRGAGKLAKRIIETRLFKTIDSTRQLAAIVEKLYGWKPRRGKTHPAAAVFQALRIEVNRELEGIEEFLQKIPRFVHKGARIVCLTFHSLEDRIVKKTFISLQKELKLKIIKPFPTFPSPGEIAANLPSRSAKLRAGEIL
jgi:16S rRNA (cytosine1402-N4)-methyltransferase